MTKANQVTTPNFRDTQKYNLPGRRDPETALMTTNVRIEGKIKSSIVDMFSLRVPLKYPK